MAKEKASNVKPFILNQKNGLFNVTFSAMASPCEFLIDTTDKGLALAIAEAGVAEVKRIEHKFSRYVLGNVCHSINNANGQPVEIDNECYRLLSFGQSCFDLSSGLFDLTSGVLRRVWKFDGSDRLPTQQQIDSVLPFVGWQHVQMSEQHIQMKAGMEIDFGGIGKEYAVSRVADLCKKMASHVSVLINLGGDIQITIPREHRQPWSVGIEDSHNAAGESKIISIVEGALATSGDAKRFLLKHGLRYSHILNPKTGWSIMHAPSSITTLAPLCIQAGCLATIALLQGRDAESFLNEQGVQYWCHRT